MASRVNVRFSQVSIRCQVNGLSPGKWVAAVSHASAGLVNDRPDKGGRGRGDNDSTRSKIVRAGGRHMSSESTAILGARYSGWVRTRFG